MLTTVANQLVAEVHPKKRMPVLLVGESVYARWLSPDLTECGSLECLFVPFSSDRMEYREGKEQPDRAATRISPKPASAWGMDRGLQWAESHGEVRTA